MAEIRQTLSQYWKTESPFETKSPSLHWACQLIQAPSFGGHQTCISVSQNEDGQTGSAFRGVKEGHRPQKCTDNERHT